MTRIYDALRRFEQEAAPSPALHRNETPVTTAPLAETVWSRDRLELARCAVLPVDWMVGLQRKLRVALPDVAAPVIQITSAQQGEGVTTVAQNLALALAAEVGDRVLLINPNVVAMAGSTPPNLLQSFAETGTIDHGVFASRHPRLAFAWLTGTNLDNRLGEPNRLFTALQAAFDFIIIDSGSVDRWVNDQALCKLADGLLLVVRAERTRWPVVEQTLETIEAVGGHVSGLVLNRRRGYLPRFLARFQ